MQDDETRDSRIYSAYLDDIQEYGHHNWERIRRATGVDLSNRSFRRIIAQLRREQEDRESEEPQEPVFNESPDGKTATAIVTGEHIKTLEGLLEACGYYSNGLDKIWRVDRHTVGKSAMGRKHKAVDLTWKDGRMDGYVHDTGDWNQVENWNVKAWFVPREEYPLEAAVDDILKHLEGHVPKYEVVKALDHSGEYLFVPSLYDAHFNKGSIDGEYTLEAAVKNYEAAGKAMIARALSLNMGIKRILFVVGQDALHIDNLMGMTTAGTWMDVAAGQRKAIDAVIRAVTYVIEQLANIAPVDVVTIEGNHDRYSTYWLGQVVAAWFKNHPSVTVDKMYDDGTPSPRKYYKFGNNLLGLDHGQDVKPEQLALIMATEAPQYWADTEYREFLRGHFHRRVNLYHQAIEEKGVTIRVLPALCPSDEWHVMKGFIGSKRAADALFYHYEHGPAGTFPVFIDELVDLK